MLGNPRKWSIERGDSVNKYAIDISPWVDVLITVVTLKDLIFSAYNVSDIFV